MTTAELTQRSWGLARSVDKVWLTIVAILTALALLDPAELPETIRFALSALLSTAPYMLFAVLAIGYLKATGAERLVAEAFKGRETRMIFVAAIVGGIAPFCSCEIIPFIAGLLAVGTPLSAVMALWLASPIMDPSIFVITAGELGWEFAVAKTAAAVALGLVGGFAVRAAVLAGYFQDVLLPRNSSGGCCSAPKIADEAPVWHFWNEPARVEIFRSEAMSNALFLLKWLALAYTLEALMIRYVPAETIAGVVGGTGLWPIVVSAFVGAPAYLNGYAAPAIVAGLTEHGMSQGAAMSFIVAGGVTSIPAMTAVFALVKRQVFVAYLVLGVGGAILSGVAFGAYQSYAVVG